MRTAAYRGVCTTGEKFTAGLRMGKAVLNAESLQLDEKIASFALPNCNKKKRKIIATVTTILIGQFKEPEAVC